MLLSNAVLQQNISFREKKNKLEMEHSSENDLKVAWVNSETNGMPYYDVVSF